MHTEAVLEVLLREMAATAECPETRAQSLAHWEAIFGSKQAQPAAAAPAATDSAAEGLQALQAPGGQGDNDAAAAAAAAVAAMSVSEAPCCAESVISRCAGCGKGEGEKGAARLKSCSSCHAVRHCSKECQPKRTGTRTRRHAGPRLPRLYYTNVIQGK